MSSQDTHALVLYDPSAAAMRKKRGRPRKNDSVMHDMSRSTLEIPDAQQVHPRAQDNLSSQTSVEANQSIPEVGRPANENLVGGRHPGVFVIHAIPAGTAPPRSLQPRGSTKRAKSSVSRASSSNRASPGVVNARTSTIANPADNVKEKRTGVFTVEHEHDGYYLITARLGPNGPDVCGVLLDKHGTVPITPENDVAPGIPMMRRHQVLNPVSAAGVHAPAPMTADPVPVTVAQPLQMRKPKARRLSQVVKTSKHHKLDKELATKTLPCDAESRIATEVKGQSALGDKIPETNGSKNANGVDPKSTSAVMPPPEPVQPMPGSSPSDANKEVPKAMKGCETVKGTESSSGKMEQHNSTIVDGVEESSGPKEQSNTENNEPLNNKASSEQPNAQSSEVLTASEGSKAVEGASGNSPGFVSQTRAFDGGKEALATKMEMVHIKDIHGKAFCGMSICARHGKQANVETSGLIQTEAPLGQANVETYEPTSIEAPLGQANVETSEPTKTEAPIGATPQSETSA